MAADSPWQDSTEDSSLPSIIGRVMDDSDLFDDYWPTKADALVAVSTIAERAREIYGNELHGVWLYGSRARGDNRPDSDLDVLVVKRFKEFDPRNRLRRDLYNALIPDHFDHPASIQLYIHLAYAEQFEEWDTMFYRSVRADAIPAP